MRFILPEFTCRPFLFDGVIVCTCWLRPLDVDMSRLLAGMEDWDVVRRRKQRAEEGKEQAHFAVRDPEERHKGKSLY